MATTAPFLQTSPYHTLFPFFLLITIVLLLIWCVVLSPSLFSPIKPKVCLEGTRLYYVQPGELCWELATTSARWEFEWFKEVNPKVECKLLMPGTSICLPARKELVGWKAAERISRDEKAKGRRRRRNLWLWNECDCIYDYNWFFFHHMHNTHLTHFDLPISYPLCVLGTSWSNRYTFSF